MSTLVVSEYIDDVCSCLNHIQMHLESIRGVLAEAEAAGVQVDVALLVPDLKISQTE